MKKFALSLSTLVSVLLVGCANSEHIDNQARNQFVTEFYAVVDNVEEVKFKSYVGEGAAVGALDGLLSNLNGDRDDMLGAAIIGGLFGGLLTAIFEGNTTGYEYQLAAVDGDVVNVIVEDKEALVGECVSVRVAGDVRIFLKPMEICEEAAKEYPNIPL